MRFIAQHHKNLYVIQLKELAEQDVCLVANKSDQLQLWHRRLGHASASVIEKLQRLNIVEELPSSTLRLTLFVKHVLKANRSRVLSKARLRCPHLDP